MRKRSKKRGVPNRLRLRRVGIDTHQEPVLYMREDCHVCRSEGFGALSRVQVSTDSRSIIATLHIVRGALLAQDEAGLSEAAWKLLAPQKGEKARFGHPPPVESLSHVRAKVYGRRLDEEAMEAIMRDIVARRYADVDLATFLTACSGDRLDMEEITAMTRAMVKVGKRLTWEQTPIADKHSVGGLPGNRTTMIVVPIIASCGLKIPKTSSRAITSPSGTADTMEVMAPVNLPLQKVREVIDKEGGCIIWGETVPLSPADEILNRVERAIDIDSESQLIASVLSKKKAAGSTHVVIDVPVGATVKVRSREGAERLASALETIGHRIGLTVRALLLDGSQPIGRGIGPALEALDILAVLRGEPNAPQDLREKALLLSGHLLELCGEVKKGEGIDVATDILDRGEAWKKFLAICEAQGGFREPSRAPYQHPVEATTSGRVVSIHNRKLARVAKLAGAPADKTSGIDLHVKIGDRVESGQPLFTVHSESEGELEYALNYAEQHPHIITIDENSERNPRRRIA